MERKMPPAAVVMLFDVSQRLLLLKRRPDAVWMPNKWGLPGGAVDAGEHCADACCRETLEETTLKITNLRLLSMNKEVAIYYSSTFEGKVKIDWEHTAWAWVPREEIVNYTTVPGIKDLYELGMMYGNKEKN